MNLDVANFNVTNLIFNKDYDEYIVGRIPYIIKYVTLHENFDGYEKDCIPSCVKEVTIIGAPSEDRIKYIQQFIPENCKLLVPSYY